MAWRCGSCGELNGRDSRKCVRCGRQCPKKFGVRLPAGTARLTACFNPDGSLADMRAALDSYGVELKKNGMVVERIPIQLAAIRPVIAVLEDGPAPGKQADLAGEIRQAIGPNPIIPGWGEHLSFDPDPSLELRLIRFEPFREEGLPAYTRWPFFVERPMEIAFQFGEQWWSFKFSPGKTYEEREIEAPAK